MIEAWRLYDASHQTSQLILVDLHPSQDVSDYSHPDWEQEDSEHYRGRQMTSEEQRFDSSLDRIGIKHVVNQRLMEQM